MDRPRGLALASAGAGLISFSTLLLPASGGALAHLAGDLTWGLIVGAVVLAALALDGAQSRRDVRALLVLALALAGARTVLLFVPAP